MNMAKKAEKKPAPKAAKKAPAVALDYHLEVSFDDVVYKGEAVSLERALEDFVKSEAFPEGAKSKVIVKISNGSMERVRVLRPLLARRIFSSISTKPVALSVLASKLTSQLE